MKENLLKNCRLEYTQNQNEYKIHIHLDNRPRTITVHIGEDFTELSLSDQHGNILESVRQQDGKGISFSAL